MRFADQVAGGPTWRPVHARLAEQEVLAGLGMRILQGDELTAVIDEAVAAVAQVLGVEFAEVLELQRCGTELLLRSGVGWPPGLVGSAHVRATLARDDERDRRDDPRVDDLPAVDARTTELLAGHGVRSGASVAIAADGKLFGVLGVQTTRPRSFTAEDLRFVQSVADLIAHAVDQRRSAQELRLLVDSVQDYAISMLDAEGRITTWNAGAERIQGYRAAEILTRHVRCLYPDDDAEAGRPEQHLETALREGRHEAQGWLVRKDGSRFFAEVMVTPVYENTGELRGFSMVTRDMTERQRLEQQVSQSQKLEAVGELAGGVAHDFNNLLTVILGYVDILLEEVDGGSAVHTDLVGISRAAERASKLVHQLLAFSRRQVLEPVVFDLNDTLRSLQSMLHRLIGEDVELVLSAPGTMLTRADPSQIEQVVVNLVINARDAMPKGGTITVETASVPPDPALGQADARLQLTVTDTGTGMTPETISHCFEPFFTTKEPGRGTGLGLATVYGIVKQSGGSIWVESEVGAGTRFVVRLPLVEDEVVAPEDPSGPATPAAAGTVLLVEDEEEVRWFARRALTRGGYRVLHAGNGVDALALADASREPIDLLLTDVVMPRLGGIELAEALRREGRVREVLFVSGHPDRVSGLGDNDLRGDQLLHKPFRAEELLERVRQVLGA